MSQFDRCTSTGGLGRNAVVAGGVVLAHAAALWALQSGLARHSPEIIVPAEVIAEFVAPPVPEVRQPPTPPALPAPPTPRPAVAKKPTPRPAPAPLAVADPASHAPPVSAPEPTPDPVPAPAAPTAPVAPVAAPAPAPAAPPRIELPSSNAAYLNNPAPSYPAISKRMGEQGKVLLRVFIDEQGRPQKVEVKQSSGYDRLDRQAQDAVVRWRFVPGKRGGVPEAMWNLVPINFVLE
ncbi:energy transducer TonB [Acidovorax sp. SRB_14]|uniref:energy transducer TonB n=1 Tax=unclassified Acidovorax TaxID=2684926 RepID=UPI00145CD738|nr:MULTISPECIES: energy transducer TonB [unclassified Acidovorax]NMM76153.1 energy transducer TonB [Acidovorax sp. SRB_24]NMM80961.1 energy transducer TonB [Acidovorax sp. SRB_14]NMM89017.1 energy transducer TonB [Rhodococcus sp. SRB_17]